MLHSILMNMLSKLRMTALVIVCLLVVALLIYNLYLHFTLSDTKAQLEDSRRVNEQALASLDEVKIWQANQQQQLKALSQQQAKLLTTVTQRHQLLEKQLHDDADFKDWSAIPLPDSLNRLYPNATFSTDSYLQYLRNTSPLQVTQSDPE